MKLSKLRAKTSMRSVGGHSIPRQNTTSFGMRNAMKASGGSCGDVEGGASRPRLDRPGRIKRADGGVVLSKEREKAASKLENESNAELAGRGIGALGTAGVMSKIGKALGARGIDRAVVGGLTGLSAFGVGNTKALADKMDEAKHLRSGRAESGKEDRASGGRVHSGSLEGLKDMKKGALRKSLHVKEGENIPEKKLEKAEHSDNPTLRRRAVLARTMRGWKKGG